MAETERLSRLPNSLRVSHQPVMVAGLTGSEFLMAIALGFLMFITVGAVTLPIMGAFHFSLLAGSVAGVAAGIALRSSIVHVKRQKPEGYPLQLVLGARHRIEPIPDLVAVEGRWDPMRHER
ncbi:MAG: DUF3487 family protein [Gammaproteobacteria bacterium]|nr:DUF3487 family protein [Gammaproteobacteria bacterium]MYG68405.1 DUF3487 family protein [Gammaproteobacteria bacterium]